jgi:hypothetical protein
MSVQGGGGGGRKLFGIELPDRLAAVARKVEALAGAPIGEVRGGDQVDVGAVVGYFDDEGKPFVALDEKAGAPTLEGVALEVLRLQHRERRFEKNMPYAEMRHPANRRLCRRLYRILEQEVLASEGESLGLAARASIRDRLNAAFLEPLAAGRYRQGETDPGRQREGALDGLEALIAEADEKAAERIVAAVGEKDAAIARPLGMMYKVVERHRPFDGVDRVRGAYYLAVPFLFDARKPTTPILRTRQA